MARRKQNREPTIALINIVFLMLVFFMVAGALSPPIDGSLKLINTSDLEGRAPHDALVLAADGTLAYRGETVDLRAFVAQHGPEVKVIPDRETQAQKLVEFSAALTAAGATKVLIVTEKALQ
ncbi:MAG: biopolymer transporter ExbD [Pseudomonadota bacterium]